MDMTTEPTYRGTPLSRITITTIVWTDDIADHIRTRTVRYADTETNLEPDWATEASLDPYRMLRLSTTTDALIVIGWSATARLVLRVFLYPINLTAGEWAGATAAKAADHVTKRYWSNR
jgi:hypothetical protein